MGSTVALGKRCREAEEPHGNEGLGINTHEIPRQKRTRGGGATNGILNAARSVARARHKPVARIPKAKISRKPKEAGRGAERLVTPNAQGVYHQSSPGPSFQQGWAAEAADGQLIWVEGRVEEEVSHHNDSTTQQQQQQEKGGNDKRFKIPKKFKEGHKALLVATEAELERGAVQEIKCRLCPDIKLKTWENYKRHCDTMEAHPLKLYICNRCGDFFARGDSLQRHKNNSPRECDNATPEEAEAKRRETQKAHDEFIGRLEGCLKTGEDIGIPFSRIIKKKYPKSSKKPK